MLATFFEQVRANDDDAGILRVCADDVEQGRTIPDCRVCAFCGRCRDPPEVYLSSSSEPGVPVDVVQGEHVLLTSVAGVCECIHPKYAELERLKEHFGTGFCVRKHPNIGTLEAERRVVDPVEASVPPQRGLHFTVGQLVALAEFGEAKSVSGESVRLSSELFDESLLDDTVREIISQYDGESAASVIEDSYLPVREFLGRRGATTAGSFATVKHRVNAPISWEEPTRKRDT